MEKYYKKIGKKYVEAGYNIPDITEGIWLVQKNPYSKSQTSLIWKVGELKRPVDIVTHASLITMTDKLANYISNLSDDTSEEYKEAKEILGGFMYGPVHLSNISSGDLIGLIIRQISMEVENGINHSWGSVMTNFRNENKLHNEENFAIKVKTLYDFTDWLKENGYELRKKPD